MDNISEIRSKKLCRAPLPTNSRTINNIQLPINYLPFDRIEIAENPQGFAPQQQTTWIQPLRAISVF
jgi:hypothetical protein